MNEISSESIEDQIGKTKVTMEFFKKLGEKLRNYQKYQEPTPISESSSIQSISLELDDDVRRSAESAGTSDELKNFAKYSAKQNFEKNSKFDEKKERIRHDEEENYEKKTKMIENSSSAKSIGIESESEGRSSTATNSKSSSSLPLSVCTKLAATKSDEAIKTNFNLGNNNILSIVRSKSDPKAVIYDLQNPNGCKIHLEKMADHATLLSVDDTGKRLFISCNF